MSLSRRIARPMLASVFFVEATIALRNSGAAAERARPVTDKVAPLAQKAVPVLPQDPEALVKVNAVVQLVAALGLATGRAPRTCAAVLATSLVPTTIAGHPFWNADPATSQQQRLHFFKNVSTLGGLLIAAGDTDGKPGVAWRTRHLAKDARREAKRVAARSPLG